MHFTILYAITINQMKGNTTYLHSSVNIKSMVVFEMTLSHRLKLKFWKLMKIFISPERPEWSHHNALFRSQIGPSQPPQYFFKVFNIIFDASSFNSISIVYFFHSKRQLSLSAC